MYIDFEGSSLCRNLHYVSYCYDLLLFLCEGQGNRTHFTVLVLDGDLAGPDVRIRIGVETELELPAGECPDGYEVDPGFSRCLDLDIHGGVVLHINSERTTLGRDFHYFTDCYNLLIRLDKGKCYRFYLTVLVLYGDLAGPDIWVRIGVENEFQLAAGECPDGHEMDPGLGRRFDFDYHIGVVLHINSERTAFSRDLHHVTYCYDLFLCLSECQCCRCYLSVLVLDGNLAGPYVWVRIGVETKLELAAGECPDGHEVDPGFRRCLDLNIDVGVVLHINSESTSLRRDLHHVTDRDDLLLFLNEGQGNRTYLPVLILDDHLAGPYIWVRIGVETKLEFAAGECPDGYKVDPGFRRCLDLNINVGVVLHINSESTSLRRNLHHITYRDYFLLFLYEGKSNRADLAVLILDGNCSLTWVGAAVFCEAELQLAALQCPYRHECNPTLCS